MLTKTSNNLYLLKLILTALVVCMHCEFPIIGRVLNPFARIAVPLFFVISGYLITTYENGKYVLGGKTNTIRIAKILKLIILPIIIYVIYKLVYNIPIDININFVIFNYFPISPPLWYCFAYIYVLFITRYIFKSITNYRLTCCIITLLLIGNLLLGSYSWIWNLTNWEGYYTRNFLFLGMPFFLIGSLIKIKESFIRWNNVMYILLAVSFIAIYLEASILKFTGLRTESIGDLYIFTIPLSILIFIYVIKLNKTILSYNSIISFSKKYSKYIYIYHILVLYLLGIYIPNGKMFNVIVNPLTLFIYTSIIVYLTSYTYKYLKKLFRNR